MINLLIVSHFLERGGFFAVVAVVAAVVAALLALYPTIGAGTSAAIDRVINPRPRRVYRRKGRP